MTADMLRDATLDDVPALVELGRAMHAESPNFAALRFNGEKLAATIRHVIQSPDGFARVATDAAGKLTGGMLALATPHWFSDDKVACDLALFIAHEHRGGMAAPRLLNAYARWAFDLGVSMVQFGVMTGIDPEKTEQLCSRLGWRRGGVIMVA